MAQLKDTVVQGSLRATDTIYTSNLQVSTIKALSDSNSTSYGVGTNGQVLRSNASSTYWASLGTAADKQITDNSSNADVTSSDTNLITGRTLYYQLAQKGYTTNTGTVTSIQVQASSPLSSSSSSASSTTLNTTISFLNQAHNTVLAGPSATNASDAAPTFRALVAADLPTATTSALGIMQVGTGLGVSSGTVSVSYGTSAGTALATSGGAGTANTASRSDHTHPLPALTDCTGTLTVAKGGTGVTSADDIFATYGIEYIVGTQTGTKASAWTGVTKSTALYVGKTIAYKLPIPGDGNATLTLTLDNGNGNNTTAYPVYAGNTRLTTHYPANSIMIMTWNGTDWRTNPYYNTNTNTLLRTYTGSANNEYPLLAQNSSANATSAWTAYTSSYKDYYGVIPNSDTTRATINLSTGKISIPGGLTVGKSTQSVAPTAGITVHDVTNATVTPNIMSQSANFIFTNNNTPDIGFYSGLHMHGGTSGDYAAWELIGPANIGDFGNEHLYVRCSKNASTWGNFRQIYDSDSTIPYTNGGTGLTTLGTAGTVLKVNDAGTGLEWGTVTGTGNGNAKIFYGTCSTGATTAAKVVECVEFDTVNDFIPGCMISVFFIYKNTAASENLTLSIGSNNTYTAGKPIRESYANLDALQYIHNTALASGSIITFIYNGNEWQLIGSTNSVYQGPLVSECVYQSDGNGSGAIITAGGLYAGKITRIGPDTSSTPSNSSFGEKGLIVNGPAYVGGTLTFQSLKLAGAQSSDAGKVLTLNANGGFDLATVSSGSSSTSGVAVTTTSNLYYLIGHTSTSGAPTTLYCNSSVYVNGNGYLYAPRVYNAVWNDYAECRKTLDDVKYGQCVIDKDDGSLEIASQRLMPGAQIVSDTWGNMMGETETTKTPIAVAGRVLAYPYRSRDKYHAGMAVCSAPNGTIDIMTREEIQKYPDCIIGIVSEIPNYEVWGGGNVKVDGRIWIKIK